MHSSVTCQRLVLPKQVGAGENTVTQVFVAVVMDTDDEAAVVAMPGAEVVAG